MTNLEGLTDEQRLVASAPVESRMLVTAGPGTGKTHTLIARLLHLIDNEGLAPGAEILVLSFSRAAVREVRRRVLGHGSASYVRVATFDSFATRLLADVDPDGTWQLRSFDPRIETATAAIREGRADEFLADFRHVVIDEAQDLVGVRSELVTALLSRDLGFTVFGDPAQGIYDFQLEDPELRRLGSAILYAWIRNHSDNLIEAALTVNFRARTADAKRALEFGSRLNGADPDFSALRRDLVTALMTTTTLGELDAAIPVLRRTEVSTAILCRTNGEALLVSERLHDAGVGHRVQQSSTDRQVGRWLAEAFAMCPSRVQSRRNALAALHDVALPDALTPDDAFRLLKRLEPRARRSADDLDLAHVAAKIRSGDLPDALCAPPDDDLIVVSTIHRAKGLEFDRVLILEPSERGQEQIDGEEARTLYVALTRPRDELYHLRPIELGRLTCRDTPDERWVRKGWKSWQRFGMEVRGDDTDPALPASDPAHVGDPVATQRYIRTSVHRGDPVDLRLRMAWVDHEERAVYDVIHEGQVVGTTRASFGGTLFRVLKVNRGWEVRFPSWIRGLRVQDIDSAAGTEAESVRSGLGPSGLWLRVRVSGLGRFDSKEPQ